MDNNKTREYGLDIYRLLSMIMITIMHIINQHYHLLDMGNSLPLPSLACSLFLYVVSFCGVNCFALLSGFLLCEAKWEYDGIMVKKYVSFWIKIVLFYFFICGVMIIGVKLHLFSLKNHLSLVKVIQALCPLTNNNVWWYISAYMGLMLLFPLIMKALTICDSQFLIKISIALFVGYSILPFISISSGAIGLKEGYSMSWLLACFIFGTCLRRNIHNILKIHNLNIFITLILIVCIGIPFVYSLLLRYLGRAGLFFFNFLSPLCLLEAVCLLILTYQIKIANVTFRKILKFCSINSLGIYLFQCHPYTWWTFIVSESKDINYYNILLCIFIWVTVICFVGIIINFCVEKLFSLSQIDNLIKLIINHISKKSIKYFIR